MGCVKVEQHVTIFVLVDNATGKLALVKAGYEPESQ